VTSQSNLNDATNIDVARKALVLRHHIIVRPFTTTLGPREETLMVEQDFQNAITSLAACRQPVIAAIFGITFGLGIDLASACDIRLAASNTVFAIAVRLPLVPLTQLM
jgi:enoyl-CoA hydratase/carnithine racemase